MKLSIIVPYRNRKNFLDIFLKHVPNYLENVLCLTDYNIIVSEQLDDTGFNRGLSVNVGFSYCDKFLSPQYIVAQNVDIIPVKNVFYKYRDFFEVWFLDAGGFKSSVSDFKRINGYCNTYYGWGTEDTDLLDRCGFYDINRKHWGVDLSKVDNPIACNLEFRNNWNSKKMSEKYWGQSKQCPLFITPEENNLPEILIDKSYQWYDRRLMDNNEKNRHKYLSLDKESKDNHYQSSGLNQINYNNITSVDINQKIHHLKYSISKVLS